MRPSILGLVIASASLIGCAGQQSAAPLAPDAGPAPVHANATEAPAPDSTPAIAEAPPQRNPETRNGRWISTATSSDFMLEGSSDQAFGVWIDVPAGATTGHVPTALTLAIDTSGSMSGDKILHAREAARRLIQEMEDGDRLSIVTFADRGRVRVEPTVIDNNSRRNALAIVEELGADGGTAMFEGLKLAESQMWNTPETHLVRRLVVISDGKATEGPTTPDALGRVAEVGLQKGIQVTSVGVGLDYDESTLNALAIRSSGRLYHVEHSHQLPNIVAEEIALLESTAATDVEVELVAAPGVTLIGTDTARMRWTDGGLVVPVGAVFSGQERELLVRARVNHAEPGTKVLASVRMHFRDPSEDGLRRVQETVLRATVTDDPTLVAAHANSRTQTLVAMREASMFTQQASVQASAGDLDMADEQLAQAEHKLHEQAKRAKTKADKTRVMRSAAKISKQRKGLAKAKKAPAAKRAKASRKLSLEMNDDALGGMGY
ncbi:MAG: VWA domain-containing protein [Myxococcota bacterium]